ncbi:cytochrome P450 monooxygenase [Penicillium verhagenii]|uniref:cytochrome P450 monooxygenase n=1 Tax=Penicillium verhagenii TaxID=1562060 RepID=UPI00254597F9|nr:cytochrome P450 monooxygenase [Penicillium verhagenii]KAJ5936912.1 cytochrome P450 monooxygenase [Penicillium verhagenii]
MDHNISSTFVIIFGVGFVFLWRIYRTILPKPIPGIPYNEASARKLLGDIPAIRAHIASTKGGTFITYVLESMQKINSPLIQVFIRPMGKPLLILGDFSEAHDILVRRNKAFDRSHTLGDLVSGLAPDHHIHLKTNAAWKSQRRLIQDLMTPSFLYTVAGPVIHHNVGNLIDLWRAKSRIAQGRPWHAAGDINLMALDAVMAFAFGEKFNHNATKPTFEAIQAIGVEAATQATRDEPFIFPTGLVDEALQATLDLTETVGEVQGNPIPSLTWAYVVRRPKIRKAIQVKEEYIWQELSKGVERLQQGETSVIQSAVDQMIMREKSLAEKDGRQPDYFSRVMIDEIFGFVFAGHETTSTTLCWGLKFLADQPQAQSKLRNALESAFAPARAARRHPNIQEITNTHIPYLDATIEEILRCAGTAPVVDREARVDTEILGYAIPKGTVVTCLVTGPSMMSAGFAIDPARRSFTNQATEKRSQFRSWDPTDIALFQPDRWMAEGPDKKGGESFDPTAGPQLAFGLGTRGCYGKRLVYLEMRILLTLAVWNFELLACPAELSGYQASLITTNEPQQCYVRLREVAR